MNQIANEIRSYIGSAEMTDEEFIEHYGVPRRSGRYPYGSGEDPYQHDGRDFLGRIEELKSKGWKETTENIKKEFGMNSSEYRMEKSIALDKRKQLQVDTAKRLKEKEGLTNTEIGKRLGVNESTVRGWFKQEENSRMAQVKETVDYIRKQVDEKGMVDVGRNVNIELGITRKRMDTAIKLLEKEGYHLYGGRVSQPTNKDQKTTLKVLTKPEYKNKDIFDYDKVKPLNDYISRDGGLTFEKKYHYPASMSSKRMKVRYAEEGGLEKDGTVEIRRGVPDLSLGKSRYSQVRILVDGTHYIKGMAIYSDNMPDGVDVIFNTNKKKGTPLTDVLKKIKSDPDNPFGSTIKDADQGGQYWYTDKDGKKKLGLINKRADEGDWSDWKDALPSQFLSKQSLPLAKKQLNLAKADKEEEFETIKSLTNPTIKKYYLDKFAKECDSAAVELKAAALPGQKYHVIIPVNTLKDTEVYAPQYKPGTKLALIRYPHGGIFEIPILTVTDKNAQAKKIIGPTSNDAICINKKVADRLSGADFDGDTVMCIPTHDKNNKVKILNKDYLKELENFDNKMEYGPDPSQTYTDKKGVTHYMRNNREYHIMKNTNTEMGIISNLITDMTLQHATDSEVARAVKHSMVVIDAEKHKLDYQQSYIDNDIASLKKKYQPVYNSDGTLKTYGGASTIVSKAKGRKDIAKTRGEPRINEKGKSWYDPTKPEGALIRLRAEDKDLYYPISTYNKSTHIKTLTKADGTKISYDMNDAKSREKYEPILGYDSKGNVKFTNKDGTINYKYKMRTETTTKMADTDDANTLVSSKRHPMEILYADYANSMKQLAIKARKELLDTPNLEYNPQSKKIYAKEVSMLESKLNNALKNAPKERYALRLANSEINRKKQENPDLSNEDIRKLSQQAVSKYRNELNSLTRKERNITITDKEWEAIQAGAISNNKLKQILDNADPDTLRERAMPKNKKGLNAAQINRIKRLSDSNFTLNQIAEKMGLSTSTIANYLKGVK